MQRLSKLWAHVRTLNTAIGLLSLFGLSALFSYTALGKSRCEADLARVDANFCLRDQPNSSSTPLSYTWQLNDQTFDLSAKLCFAPTDQLGKRRDLIIAIDRSQSMRNLDSARRSAKNDSISMARQIIEQYQSESSSTGSSTAAKIGLVLFAGDPLCRQYAAGTSNQTIAVERDFPCLYISPRPANDSGHVQQMLALLKAADNAYAQRMPIAGDYGIVSDWLEKEMIATSTPWRTGVLLLSNGLSYRGDANDNYQYLKAENYTRMQNEIGGKFQKPDLKKIRLIVALNPVQARLFGSSDADAYANMCDLSGSTTDCDKTKVDVKNPDTWPVNKTQTMSFARLLVAATGGAASDAAEVANATALNQLLEKTRISADDRISFETAKFSVNGEAEKTATITDNKITVSDIKASNPTSITLRLLAANTEIKFPVQITTNLGVDIEKDLADKEMLCTADLQQAKGVAAATNAAAGSGKKKKRGCGLISSAVEAGSEASLAFDWLIALLLIMPLFALPLFEQLNFARLKVRRALKSKRQA